MKKPGVVLRKHVQAYQFNSEIVETMVRSRIGACPHCGADKPFNRLVCESCHKRYEGRLETALTEILTEKSDLLKPGVLDKKWDEAVGTAKAVLARDNTLPVGKLMALLEERFPEQDYFAPLRSLLRKTSLLKTLLLKEVAEEARDGAAGMK